MITHDMIRIKELGDGEREARVTLTCKGCYTPVHLKALIIQEIYGDKNKELELLERENARLNKTVTLLTYNGSIIQDQLTQVRRMLARIDRVSKITENKEPNPSKNIIQDIQEKTCTYFSISIELLKSNKRFKNIVLARHIAMYLTREQGFSFPEIAREFNRRDHTTVIHAVKKIEEQIMDDQKLGCMVDDIREAR